MSENMIELMRLAVENRDFAQFVHLLDQRPEMWTSEAKLFLDSDSNVSLLRKLTTVGFAIGLQHYTNLCC